MVWLMCDQRLGCSSRRHMHAATRLQGRWRVCFSGTDASSDSVDGIVNGVRTASRLPRGPFRIPACHRRH